MSGPQQSVFSRRTIAWLAGVSVVSFLAALLLAGLVPDPAEPLTAGANAFSRSAIGHHALVELLARGGIPVRLRRSPVSTDFGPRQPLVVLAPALHAPGMAEQLDDLRRLASEAGAPMILVLPKWTGVPRFDARWLRSVAPIPAQELREGLDTFLLLADPLDPIRGALDSGTAADDLRDCRFEDASVAAVEIDAPRFLTGEAGPLVCAGGALALWLSVDRPSDLLIVSDPDLLNNHGLGRGDHAAVALALLGNREAWDALVIDETLHGFAQSPNLVAELLRFPLVLALMHGFLVLGLAVWGGMARFGRSAEGGDRRIVGRQALIDTAAQLLCQGRHLAESGRRYFEQVLRDVAAHYFLPGDMPIAVMQRELQRISDTKGLEVNLETLRHGLGRGGVARMNPAERTVRLARRLNGWRREMTRGSDGDS